MIGLADSMIKTFLNLFKSIYGVEHFTSNLHNLIHLVAEVRTFGVLSKFSAYSFEDKMQFIKRLVRSGNQPLNRIAKRILESEASVEIEHLDEESKIKLCRSTNFD